MNHEQDKEQLIQELNFEKNKAVQTALDEFKLERELVEKELLEKVKHLEKQIAKSPALCSFSKPIKIECIAYRVQPGLPPRAVGLEVIYLPHIK